MNNPANFTLVLTDTDIKNPLCDEQLSQIELPAAVVQHIEADLDENTPEVEHKVEPPSAAAKKMRFQEITSDEIDEIASHSAAKSTKYQTTWAVRVFRGT